tara:strand:+ start:361 stop:1644 length:1284 start_codon:yes stop_codon:yes gene_type:complete
MANNRELSQFANVVGYNGGKVGIGTESPVTMLEVGSQSETLAGAITISNGETIAGGSGPTINLKHGPAGGTQRTHQIYSYIGDLRIAADSNENMEFHTGGSESLRIASDGDLTLTGADNVEIKMKCGSSSGNNILAFLNSSGTTRGNITYDSDNNFLLFNVNQSERLRITAAGSMGLGTSSPDSYVGGGENLVIADSSDAGMTIASGTSNSGTINFADGTSGDARYRGRIEYAHSLDALDILTAASTRVRIDSTGRLLVNTLSASNGASYGNIVLEFAGDSYNGIKTRDTDNNGTVTHLVFVSGSAAVGSITGDTGQAYYNNLSDYRRKENDVEIADGIQKLKLLRPIRFNYISDPNTVCDGFFAHEVTPAVPTAVTGAKDAVDSEGEIDPQMLDASKLVPLLTAALQEAIAKIETLETKVAALENP